ncbi:Metal-dependent hydrolase, endonuclease/exonuclease/phosphatase family [Paenibacillus sp. yr247]|uniref:endonuclease/exonuclease/phosphatase family protein n=1 Tax=Paenibacillus sp. yr247 TaxID=1761880 RepID=UPI000887862C|nr:endonuclease/exonuclease/phosphatase family protein [Paenibacillus sp. yr247]SDN71984.1 Metal-dependent hydrolase, endonuclease/exonuclease/phosphatase family [Paenibacillus sp. yr247]
MTFNLRYNNPGDGPNSWPHRIDRVMETIRAYQPLVLGTQEGYFDMLQELHPKLDEYDWIGEGRFGAHENEHCAIFYKKVDLDLQQYGQFWLSESPEEVASISWNSGFPRVCTWAEFEHRESRKRFIVYNTHLDHQSQQARDLGSKVIWKYIAAHRMEYSLPIILMGDFNSRPTDLPIRFLRGESELQGLQTWLKDTYAALSGPIGLTAHDFKGGEVGEPIDYIFVSPDVEVLEAVVDRRQIDGVYPSDHYPVVAQLQL